jgi:predicted molibdopterin-dependent oxidoreductase YjgC
LTTDLQSLADEIVGAKAAVILYDEQTTFEPGGKDLAADLQALAVLSGQIDRPGAGVGPLFGDANSLGAREMGLLPDALPGYKPVASPGLTYDEILSSSQIKALFVMGANPVRHLPDGRLPASLELTVVQELLPTETVAQADVVLPAVSFAEKDGSMTNVDHHVQAIRRALRPLPGAQADWQILIALANALGHGWSYENPQAILQEIAERNPFYAGLSWEALGKQGVRTTREQEVSHV